jgi:predicted nucleic acid-binding protein
LNIVVDANVIVKWYIAEPGWQLARSVVEYEGLLLAPGHVLGEVGHVLVQRYREKQFTKAQLDLARVAIPGSLLLISLDDLFDLAMEIAERTGETFYDSLYIAAAERWDTFVVTADTRLVRKLRGSPWDNRAVSLEGWQLRAGA